MVDAGLIAVDAIGQAAVAAGAADQVVCAGRGHRAVAVNKEVVGLCGWSGPVGVGRDDRVVQSGVCIGEVDATAETDCPTGSMLYAMVQLTAVSVPPCPWMPAPVFSAELPVIVLLTRVSAPPFSSMPPPWLKALVTELSERVLSVIVNVPSLMKMPPPSATAELPEKVLLVIDHRTITAVDTASAGAAGTVRGRIAR